MGFMSNNTVKNIMINNTVLWNGNNIRIKQAKHHLSLHGPCANALTQQQNHLNCKESLTKEKEH